MFKLSLPNHKEDVMAYQTIYPYTNEVLKTYDNTSDADLEKALAAGHDL